MAQIDEEKLQQDFSCRRKQFFYIVLAYSLFGIMGVFYYFNASPAPSHILNHIVQKPLVSSEKLLTTGQNNYNRVVKPPAVSQKFYPMSLASSIDTVPNPKLILFWSEWMGDTKISWIYDNFRYYPVLRTRQDPNRMCILSHEKVLIPSANAVIIHGCDLYQKGTSHVFPDVRFPWQRWIYFQTEVTSNPNCYTPERAKQVPHIVYNWSMTYSIDADVWYQYGALTPRQSQLSDTDRRIIENRIKQHTESFASREFDAVWLVSNCNSWSYREILLSQLLARGVKIDRWGNCGQGDPRVHWRKIGYDNFFSRYRFYFAAENSLCENYITEKPYMGFFHNIYQGLIPIVWGGGGYTRILPNGTYINAYEMKTVDELVALMRSLANMAPEQLAQSPYFHWQLNYEFEMNPDLDTDEDGHLRGDYSHRFGMRNLCERIWEADDKNETKSIPKIEDTFSKCYGIPEMLKSAT